MQLNLNHTDLCATLKQSETFRRSFVTDYERTMEDAKDRVESAERDRDYYKGQYNRECENRRSVERQLASIQTDVRELASLRHQITVLTVKANGGNVDEVIRHDEPPFYTLSVLERNAAIEIMRQFGAHDKIGAIKAVRASIDKARGETGCMGLANAKWFVENDLNRQLAGYEVVPF